MSQLIHGGPFHGLKKNYYRVILADPAWTFVTRSDRGKGRSPERHYGCMSLADIRALPVRDLAAKDCVLLLWTIDTLLPQAIEVAAAWGFTFKTVGFYWVKTNRDGSPFTGMGYWTRANPEQCLLATSGDADQCILATSGTPRRVAKNVPRLVMSERREHSRKPDEIHDLVCRLIDGPYLELFARSQRVGWDAWGNEKNKFSVNDPEILSILDGDQWYDLVG